MYEEGGALPLNVVPAPIYGKKATQRTRDISVDIKISGKLLGRVRFR